MTNVKPRKRAVRGLVFGLAAASVFIVCISSYIAVKRKQSARTCELIVRLQAMGDVHVIFEHQVDEDYMYDFNAKWPGPSWLRRIVGEEAFCKVVGVQFYWLADPKRLADLSEMPNLRFLQVYGGDVSPIGDADLTCLRSFHDLQVLSIPGSHVSKEGIAHIAAVSGLTILDIRGVPIGDEVIQELVKLKHLEHLYIDDTEISERGTIRLRREMRSCQIGRCTSKSFLFNVEPFG